MKTARAVLASLALAVVFVPARADGPADAAAKQKELADLMGEILELAKRADETSDPELVKKVGTLDLRIRKLTEELGGSEKEGQEKALMEALKAHRPDVYAIMAERKIQSLEDEGVSMLFAVTTAESEIRGGDHDGNQAADHWVADVSGLCRIVRSGAKEGSGILDAGTAWADAAPAVPLAREGILETGGKDGTKVAFSALAAPKREMPYRLVAMRTYEMEGGRWGAYNDGTGRNALRYGFCAFPRIYGETGRMTFIVNEFGEVWEKDLGGLPVFAMPLDPEAEGWKPAR